MNRGTTDEDFVRKAYETADSNAGRFIAGQSKFNYPDSHALEPVAVAGIVTAIAIFVHNNKLPESAIAESLKIKTCGDARKFIDKYEPMVN